MTRVSELTRTDMSGGLSLDGVDDLLGRIAEIVRGAYGDGIARVFFIAGVMAAISLVAIVFIKEVALKTRSALEERADEEAADRALPSTTASDLDAEFDEMRAQAQAKHCVLRYVGLIDVEKKIIKAGLEAYPADHPFATSLGGSDNILSFTTERYPRPLLVQGAGAGADVTAMGVVADLVRVAERRG